MLFSLKRQRHNRQNTLAVIPPRGKLEKSSIFHRTVEMEQPHTIIEPFYLALSYTWLFCFINILKYMLFIHFFRWRAL